MNFNPTAKNRPHVNTKRRATRQPKGNLANPTLVKRPVTIPALNDGPVMEVIMPLTSLGHTSVKYSEVVM